MRLFVSIKPPEETLGYLENCIAGLANLNKRMPIKWSDRSLLHSTVLFLGEVEEQSLLQIKEIISEEVSELTTFFIDLGAPDLIFKGQKPSIMFMKVFDQSGTLQELHDRLLERIKKIIKIEEKPFSPHITLARVKGTLRHRKKISIESGHIDAVFPVESIELVESVLTPIGPLHTTLATFEVPHA